MEGLVNDEMLSRAENLKGDRVSGDAMAVDNEEVELVEDKDRSPKGDETGGFGGDSSEDVAEVQVVESLVFCSEYSSSEKRALTSMVVDCCFLIS